MLTEMCDGDEVEPMLEPTDEPGLVGVPMPDQRAVAETRTIIHECLGCGFLLLASCNSTSICLLFRLTNPYRAKHVLCNRPNELLCLLFTWNLASPKIIATAVVSFIYKKVI